MAELVAYADLAACAAPPRVRSVRGREALSEPFRYEVELDVQDFDRDAARGDGVYVHLRDEAGRERHLHGVVECVRIHADHLFQTHHVVLTVRPPHYLLHYRRGFRIFQELSVPDIVRQVFDAAGIGADQVRWTLAGDYPVRTYCVQYDESEWDFVCRLLEDEGIHFAFEHGPDGVVMVIADDSQAAPALAGDFLRFRFVDRDHPDDDAGVMGWTSRRQLTEGRVALEDYDGLHPSTDLSADHEDDEPHAREHYEYPGGYAEASEGTRRARVRLEELATRRRSGRARSDHIGLQPGLGFELLDHPLASGEHVVTAIEIHVVPEVDVRSESPDAPSRSSRVQLECVPREQTYRPPRRTPRPRIHGVQTAKVTGPAGEEIHCDEHGRVKVQFHWDLDGEMDERTSCWIRSTHPHTTGSVTVPRIGWEVLVQFYEGDPDRPVALGHLFNPLHPPAFPLPASKTMTAHRTVASPGAGAVNEVTFDDAASAQRIEMNAGRDLTIDVVENKTMQTTRNYRRNVIQNRTFSVGTNQAISLEADTDDAVGADQTLSVGANRTVRVAGNAAATVGGSTTMAVSGFENMMVGNPVDAVVSTLQNAAIGAAQGAAAIAANRIQGALLGPVTPAINGARGALGAATDALGPAGAILGGDNPAVAIFGDTLSAVNERTTPPDLAAMAGGAAAAATSDALNVSDEGGGGGSDTADDDAPPGGPTGPAGGVGGGTWGTDVTGDMTESIGAVAAITAAGGVTLATAGSVTETIGAARVVLPRGGWSEECASKTETVGVYTINTKGGIGVQAGAGIALNTASSEWKLGGSYAATAGGAVAVTASAVKLDARQTVTLKCGPAEVIVDRRGIACRGATSVTIQGTLALRQPAIGP